MSTLTIPPLRSPTPKPLIYPWKQPFAIDPSCVLCLLPIRDNKWYDFSGKGNHGTIEGATWTAKGPVGPALYFDGTNDYVSLTGFTLAQTTWALEIGIVGLAAGIADQYIFDTQSGRLFMNWTLVGALNLYDGAYRSLGTLTRSTTRHHFVLLCNGTTSKASLYIDAVLNAAPVTYIPANIGGRVILMAHYTNVSGFTNGYLDTVRVYSTLPSESEIKALYELWLSLKVG